MVVSSHFGVLTCICPGRESLATHIERVVSDGRTCIGDFFVEGVVTLGFTFMGTMGECSVVY